MLQCRKTGKTARDEELEALRQQTKSLCVIQNIKLRICIWVFIMKHLFCCFLCQYYIYEGSLYGKKFVPPQHLKDFWRHHCCWHAHKIIPPDIRDVAGAVTYIRSKSTNHGGGGRDRSLVVFLHETRSKCLFFILFCLLFLLAQTSADMKKTRGFYSYRLWGSHYSLLHHILNVYNTQPCCFTILHILNTQWDTGSHNRLPRDGKSRGFSSNKSFTAVQLSGASHWHSPLPPNRN